MSCIHCSKPLNKEYKSKEFCSKECAITYLTNKLSKIKESQSILNHPKIRDLLNKRKRLLKAKSKLAKPKDPEKEKQKIIRKQKKYRRHHKRKEALRKKIWRYTKLGKNWKAKRFQQTLDNVIKREQRAKQKAKEKALAKKLEPKNRIKKIKEALKKVLYEHKKTN